VTTSSEARVPHDPQDLRSAVKHLRSMRCCNEPCACVLVVRLEAWAHDTERLAPLEAAVLDAAREHVDSLGKPFKQTTLTKLIDAVRALQEAT
jgi:hypothetical protein